MIAGLDNVFAYIDDLVVGRATQQEHDQNLFKLFERIHTDFMFASKNLLFPQNRLTTKVKVIL